MGEWVSFIDLRNQITRKFKHELFTACQVNRSSNAGGTTALPGTTTNFQHLREAFCERPGFFEVHDDEADQPGTSNPEPDIQKWHNHC